MTIFDALIIAIMSLQLLLKAPIQQALRDIFNLTSEKIEFQATRKEFAGDITLVLFPFLKEIKSSPAEIGNQLGAYLVTNSDVVSSFNVVSGFLNIVISDQYFISFFTEIRNNSRFGFVQSNPNEKAIMVEYS
jgi:arginyl-tRNA synthetase